MHRVFPKGTVIKVGHTTNRHDSVTHTTSPEDGFLWDVTNCYRDNFLARIDQQAKLWGGEPNYKCVPLHFNHPIDHTREEIEEILKEPHWTFKKSPFDLPMVLKEQVGRTKYLAI